MSEVTKTLHRKVYPAIDAASPEQSQAGRKILITGGSAVIGRAAAEAFVTAGADTVVITSRSAEKAKSVAKEIETAGNGSTKVVGYQYEIKDIDSVKALWDQLELDGIQIDVLVLNTTDLTPSSPEPDQTLFGLFKFFESGVRNQSVNVDRFQRQGAKEGKALIYVSTNATHFHGLPLHYTAASSPRLAFNRMLSDLAANTPVEQVQILSIHPGFVLTPENMKHGYKADSLGVPFDEASLPGNFFVWAATKKAAFLHGRFVWANWDVEELISMKDKFEADPGFLRAGLQGVKSQDFGMLISGMARSV
ncbi:uncharacterized protein BHQ10_008836 [Talaromyces amestolkiae]|uniref:Uncharacterized protein n=1 Tax=Talaromyces amestolkiae TaxID=1196081 RepID=A0A364LAH8_TALAM|nr:uncharacterized protein BHQ10_008836 [Talaromyces amestolkiae]RAO72824.1 hypothetical protein BHQ10_008836 [Talaromyces amestolkiae]